MTSLKKHPRRKVNEPETSSGGRFRPTVFLIWLALIAGMVSLWVLSPENPALRKTPWTVSQLLWAAQQGWVTRGTVKADPSRGPEWYVITGQSRNPDHHGGVADVPEFVEFEVEGRLTPERYNLLLDKGVHLVEKPASTLLTDLLVSLLPFLVILGLLYFVFIRQIKMAGKTAFSFGKSKARMLTQDKQRVRFSDVAGCQEAKEEVSEVVDFLRAPQKFQDIGGRIPKGILMVGPPGTGKTLIAKAVAGEADVPFFSISGSDFVEMFVGVGAARVRDMFEQGRKQAPCIIFIDEIDAVGRQRGAGLGGGNDEREQTLNSLLVEMDGFDGHEGIIIIAATNRPDVLDSALLRPGRFDRQVVIDLPDVAGREEILRLHAKKIKLHDGVDLSVVARNTAGFSGADLANLLNESALLAARENQKKVSRHHLDEARDKIAYGRERRKLMDAEDKKITAYHEAGHAIVQVLIDEGKLPVHKVTIIPRGQSLGSTMLIPSKDILNYGKKFVLNQICCFMGGRVAEELTFGDVTSGAAADIKSATHLARKMVCDWGMADLGPIAFGDNQDHIFLGKEIARSQNYSEQTAQRIDAAIGAVITAQYQRAMELLQTHQEALEKVAQALLEYETIEGKHVQEILKAGALQSPVTPFRGTPKDDAHGPDPESKHPDPERLKPGSDPLAPGVAPAPA
jgi:cell division protease FtsH